jgi:hypothetical protein
MAVTTIEKIQALFAPAISVSATDDGYLAISGLSQEATSWVETAPLVFQQVGGQETIAFRADAQGRISYLFKGNLPINGYRRLVWYEALPVQYSLLAGCVVLLFSALLGWPIGWLATRRKAAPQPGLAGMARWLAWVVSTLDLRFLILFVVSLQDLTRFPTPLTKVALGMALVATILTIGMVASAAGAWRRRYWNVAVRAYYTLITLGALAFVWFLNYWNLLGFQW